MDKHISAKETSPYLDTEFLKRLSDAIKETRFGSIEIVIHDNRVVQIETRKKHRFESK